MNNIEDAQIDITRVFDAPRELVFKAWTDPVQFANWFGGELTIPMETVQMDVRPGGAWQATMLTPEGGELLFSGEFREINEPERLVMTLTDRTGPGVQVVTVVFTERDHQTEMVFRQVGPLPKEIVAQTTEGWNSFFDRMVELVTKG